MGSLILKLYPFSGALGRIFDIQRFPLELMGVVSLVELLGHLGVVQWHDPIWYGQVVFAICSC